MISMATSMNSATLAGRASLPGLPRSLQVAGRPFTARRQQVVRAAAQTDDVGAPGVAAVALGALANPLVLYSDYVLKTTGRGLPEGPGGLYGAAEGVSYLVILGIVGWSLATKVRTGSGLPAGPSGLLGAVEGFSYLTLVVSIAAFTLTFLEKGSLPGALG